MRLNAVGLFVKDMATMVAFYRDVVGFAMKWDGIDPEGNLIEIATWKR